MASAAIIQTSREALSRQAAAAQSGCAGGSAGDTRRLRAPCRTSALQRDVARLSQLELLAARELGALKAETIRQQSLSHGLTSQRGPEPLQQTASTASATTSTCHAEMRGAEAAAAPPLFQSSCWCWEHLQRHHSFGTHADSQKQSPISPIGPDAEVCTPLVPHEISTSSTVEASVLADLVADRNMFAGGGARLAAEVAALRALAGDLMFRVDRLEADQRQAGAARAEVVLQYENSSIHRELQRISEFVHAELADLRVELGRALDKAPSQHDADKVCQGLWLQALPAEDATATPQHSSGATPQAPSFQFQSSLEAVRSEVTEVSSLVRRELGVLQDELSTEAGGFFDVVRVLEESVGHLRSELRGKLHATGLQAQAATLPAHDAVGKQGSVGLDGAVDALFHHPLEAVGVDALQGKIMGLHEDLKSVAHAL
eukprot:CAMPEP_0179138762 /NCGR_PEP_ID=MMETSP0796-20121207/66297_1 /TAXON_ID=73915 /ORGANISM="Pyrodinium bahamense, Strain pbaha01" /LENGTH=430 /DNA_ID=CAMNT_0020838083 /DNA_START=27 /DNA_END=1316 /DNA_ORIENTATION=-